MKLKTIAIKYFTLCTYLRGSFAEIEDVNVFKMTGLTNCLCFLLEVLFFAILLQDVSGHDNRFESISRYSSKHFFLSHPNQQGNINSFTKKRMYSPFTFIGNSQYRQFSSKENSDKYNQKLHVNKRVKTSNYFDMDENNFTNKKVNLFQRTNKPQKENSQSSNMRCFTKKDFSTALNLKQEEGKHTKVKTNSFVACSRQQINIFILGENSRIPYNNFANFKKKSMKYLNGHYQSSATQCTRSSVILQMSNNNDPSSSDHDIKENEMKVALGSPILFSDTLKIALGVLAFSIGLSFLDHTSMISIPIFHQINSQVFELFQSFKVDEFFQSVQNQISNLGPLGYVYFAFVYIIAELLAVPAIPLTASSGYLFGVYKGTGIVLISATIAASLSFLIGRTLLRDTVEKWMINYPKFKAFDKAIGKEGFKIILLLRLSPIFPFALSNYMYGLTSVDFWSYVLATCIGFTPGTIAYVYSGTIGKALTETNGIGIPWYYYLGIAGGFGIFVKIISDIAMEAIKEYEESPENDEPKSL